MSIKTIDHNEFEKLLTDEYGDVLPRPLLIQSFDPEELLSENWEEPKKSALKSIHLNVVEPMMYTDKQGHVLVVYPRAPLTYDAINSFFPDKNAWVYTASATVGADLDDRYYFFRNGRGEWDGNVPLPKYRHNDTSTH